ncbi:hypothetical protein KC19_1G266600 [Ceratodon purpureus]|uniref:Uncharacterized protein n=1 Tax=Ceratodon purpureus TaxID=3225 RepID=A0A8T0JCP6_CERPU|nr:hypothetical protein KC19_1G266600 [Ceratodon purpureus]
MLPSLSWLQNLLIGILGLPVFCNEGSFCSISKNLNLFGSYSAQCSTQTSVKKLSILF